MTDKNATGWEEVSPDAPIEELIDKVMAKVSIKEPRKRGIKDEQSSIPTSKNDSGDVTEGQHTSVPRETKRKGPGRPSMLTRELMDELGTRLALRSLPKVCEDDDMPERVTIWRWLTKGDHDIQLKQDTLHAEFVTVFAHARARRADAYMEDAEGIIDDGSNDWVEKEGKHGPYMALNHEHVSRSKLRFEGRMRLAEKINPKKYAPMQKHADADGDKLPAPGEVNDLELARRIAFVLEKAKGKVE